MDSEREAGGDYTEECKETVRESRVVPVLVTYF